MISISKLNSHFLRPAITLNLQSEKGQSLLYRLIPHFDVLIENHRPGVMKRLVRSSGNDKVVQAMSGLMDLTGDADCPPTKAGGSPGDYIAAPYGALAIVSAVLHRSQTGKRQFIDLALLDGLVSTLSAHVCEYLSTGEVLRRSGNFHPPAAATGAFASRSTTEVTRTLVSANVLCGDVKTLAELAEDPQINHRGRLLHFETDAWGKVPGVAMPLQSSEMEWDKPSAPPRLGEHNADVLGSMLGLTQMDIDQ